MLAFIGLSLSNFNSHANIVVEINECLPYIERDIACDTNVIFRFYYSVINK